MKNLLTPPWEWRTQGWYTGSQELVTVLTEDRKNSDNYKEKNQKLQKEIEDVKRIIFEYTWKRTEYEEIYNEKKSRIEELDKQHRDLVRENMSQEEQQKYIEDQKKLQEALRLIFSCMWFNSWWIRWEFESEEEFFKYQKQQSDKKEKENYVKKDMSEITGELAEQLRDMSIKKLWRMISKLLHPDVMIHNEINLWDQEYYKELYIRLNDYYEQEDLWSIILTLQETSIQFKDGILVLPSQIELWDIKKTSKLQKIYKKLQEHLNFMKETFVYIFYLKFQKGDIVKELRELDDKIEELEDIILSYQHIDDEQ